MKWICGIPASQTDRNHGLPWGLTPSTWLMTGPRGWGVGGIWSEVQHCLWAFPAPQAEDCALRGAGRQEATLHQEPVRLRGQS